MWDSVKVSYCVFQYFQNGVAEAIDAKGYQRVSEKISWETTAVGNNWKKIPC